MFLYVYKAKSFVKAFKPVILRFFKSKTKSKIYATNFHFLGHKHPENDTYKLFDNKTLFNEVINKESQNEEISEEQIPF